MSLSNVHCDLKELPHDLLDYVARVNQLGVEREDKFEDIDFSSALNPLSSWSARTKGGSLDRSFLLLLSTIFSSGPKTMRVCVGDRY